MSLARVGIRGAYFTGLALGFRQLVSLGATFYIARQLLPADIGLFSMVMVVVGMAQIIGDIGIAAGLVRTQKNSEEILSTCFWIGTLIGSILACVTILLAPVAGLFYGKPEIIPLLRASAIGILINFMMPVPMALLQQRLAYKEISISQGIGSLVGAIIAIVLVSSRFGVWGLVVQPIAGNAVIFVLLIMYSRWKPALIYDIASARDVLNSGMHLLFSGLTGYFRNNLDGIVIGKALRAEDLGIYGMAQTILYAPMHLITSTVSRVIFPLLAKVQDDISKVKEAVLSVTSRTALLIFPLYFGVVDLADEFVLAVFGTGWFNMVPLIRIMAVSYLIQSIVNVTNPLMLALGKTKVIMWLSIGGAVVYFAVLLLSVPYGLKVVAFGYTSANSLIAIFSLFVSLNLAKLSIADYLRSVSKPLIFSCIMCVAIEVSKYLFGTSGLIILISQIFIGILIYASLVYLFEKPVLAQVISALTKA